ncbi:MLO-like protein 11 isoform X1 [Tanacetum coccineum]|uniref:MLO-like protein 11 isoform X1 n=1 Tax=Tanacetum coccineum TaxID=301880 RepID=A0ABQ5EJ42_9ASTR
MSPEASQTQTELFLNEVELGICFFRQFGRSVVRADYLTLRKAFIMNHNLTSIYDFRSYMIHSMEEEFQRIVGVSGPFWGLNTSSEAPTKTAKRELFTQRQE